MPTLSPSRNSWPSRRRALAAAGLILFAAACAGTASGPAPAASARPIGTASPSGKASLHVWPSRGPTQAVILALHGFGDAGELAFGDAAAYWAGRGITVYAPDLPGFGGNPDRKRWPGVDALVAETVALSRRVAAAHPGVPLVVVGESMGGGIALLAADEGLAADALVLSAPAIAGGDSLSPAARTAARLLAAVAPEKRWTGEGMVELWPTDNMAALRRTAADPRHFGDPSSRELYGLVELMDRAAAVAPDVDRPTLTLMGRNDEILRPENVARVATRIPGAIGYIEYPNGWHWLFRDLDAAVVWRDVADFALSPTGAARD